MIDFKKLAEPFPAKDLEWRAQREGKGNKGPWVMVVCYVDNRAIQNRLDEVCGPPLWRNEFREWRIGEKSGVLCGLSIFTPGLPANAGNIGQWVTKWDGADPTDIEPIKGGLSDSMKRAAVQWGIGRYLYDLDATFARVVEERQEGAKQATEKADRCWWLPPKLPAWALPQEPEKKSVDKMVTQALVDAINKLYKEKGQTHQLDVSIGTFSTYEKALAEYKRLKALPLPAREEKNAA